MAREIDRVELIESLGSADITLLDAQGPGWFEKEHPPGAVRRCLDDPESTMAELGGIDRRSVDAASGRRSRRRGGHGTIGG